jgi:hypothetical protein
MKKAVLLSCNNNPDYLFYAKYQEIAWNKLGWDVILACTDDVDETQLGLKNTQIIKFKKVPELRDITMGQICRHYAPQFIDDETLLMSNDIDMIPLSDYWHPNPDEITIYGHDLTGYQMYPISYIVMKAKVWKRIMNYQEDVQKQMLDDAKEIGLALSEDWEKWWNHDWILVTKRFESIKDSIKFIDRGKVQVGNAGLAVGRVDRFNWDATVNSKPLIDAHCENINVKHPDKLNKFLKLFENLYGKV